MAGTLLQPTEEKRQAMYRPVQVFNFSQHPWQEYYGTKVVRIDPGCVWGVAAMFAWSIFGDPSLRSNPDKALWYREMIKMSTRRDPGERERYSEDGKVVRAARPSWFEKYVLSGELYCLEMLQDFLAEERAQGRPLTRLPNESDRDFIRRVQSVFYTNTNTAGKVETVGYAVSEAARKIDMLIPMGAVRPVSESEILSGLGAQTSTNVRKAEGSTGGYSPETFDNETMNRLHDENPGMYGGEANIDALLSNDAHAVNSGEGGRMMMRIQAR